MTMDDRIERVFKELDNLLKTGKFEIRQLEFMEMFLQASLNATRKVISRVKGKVDNEKKER